MLEHVPMHTLKPEEDLSVQLYHSDLSLWDQVSYGTWSYTWNLPPLLSRALEYQAERLFGSWHWCWSPTCVLLLPQLSLLPTEPSLCPQSRSSLATKKLTVSSYFLRAPGDGGGGCWLKEQTKKCPYLISELQQGTWNLGSICILRKPQRTQPIWDFSREQRMYKHALLMWCLNPHLSYRPKPLQFSSLLYLSTKDDSASFWKKKKYTECRTGTSQPALLTTDLW